MTAKSPRVPRRRALKFFYCIRQRGTKVGEPFQAPQVQKSLVDRRTLEQVVRIPAGNVDCGEHGPIGSHLDVEQPSTAGPTAQAYRTGSVGTESINCESLARSHTAIGAWRTSCEVPSFGNVSRRTRGV